MRKIIYNVKKNYSQSKVCTSQNILEEKKQITNSIQNNFLVNYVGLSSLIRL